MGDFDHIREDETIVVKVKRDSKVDHTCVACFGALTDKILHTRHVRNGQEAQSICNRNIMGRWAGSCSWSAFIAGIVIMPHLVANQIVRAPTAKGGRCEHFLGAVNQASATRPQRDRNETAVSRSLVSCSDEMVYEFLGWYVRLLVPKPLSGSRNRSRSTW